MTSLGNRWNEDDNDNDDGEKTKKMIAMMKNDEGEDEPLASSAYEGRRQWDVHIEECSCCFSPSCHYYATRTALCCLTCFAVYPSVNHCWRLSETLSVPPSDELGGEVLLVDVGNASRLDCLCSYFCCSLADCPAAACHKGMLTAPGPYVDITFQDPYCCNTERHFLFTAADMSGLLDAMAADPYLADKMAPTTKHARYSQRDPYGGYCQIL